MPSKSTLNNNKVLYIGFNSQERQWLFSICYIMKHPLYLFLSLLDSGATHDQSTVSLHSFLSFPLTRIFFIDSPVHSLMLSSHRLVCLHLLFLGTVSSRKVFASSEDLMLYPYSFSSCFFNSDHQVIIMPNYDCFELPLLWCLCRWYQIDLVKLL